MTFSSILISVIFFAFVATGFVIFYDGGSDRYGVAKTSANFSLINDTTTIKNKLYLLQNKTTSITQDFQLTDIFDLSTLYVFQAGGLLMDMGQILITTPMRATQLFTSIPIPTWFTAMLIVIALVFLIFAVLGMALRRDV